MTRSSLRRMPSRPLAVIGALTLAVLAACGSGDKAAAPASAGRSAASGGELTVYAAASLKGAYTELAKDFEKSHPGVTVKFNFAGSSDLAAQINQGAPVDVFASADEKNMKKVVDAGGMAGTPEAFVRNKLTVVVAKDNPKGIKAFSDLTRSDLKVVVCAPEVPCGDATEKVERNTNVSLKPVSEESKVTDVLAKVSSGEADAGLVYVTDVKSAKGEVAQVDIPDDVNAINVYPIGVTKSSENSALAGEFVALVKGPEGQKVLNAAGFMPPR